MGPAGVSNGMVTVVLAELWAEIVETRGSGVLLVGL